MVKPQEVLGDRIPAFERREDDFDYEKIPSVEALNLPVMKKEFRIRFDDLDVNQHVNNANYIAWALETLDYNFKCENAIKSMDVYYKKDIAFDGKIVAEACLDYENLSSVHSIKNAQTQEELCSLKIEWAKI